MGGPCANPSPPYFLNHLQLVGLTSCGFNLFLALLVLLVRSMYGPLVERGGEGGVDVATALRYNLRPDFLSRTLLLLFLFTELSLSEVAAIALSNYKS